MDITREAVNTYFYRTLSNPSLVSVKSKGAPKPNKYKLTNEGQKIINSNLEAIDKYWIILNKINKLKNQFFEGNRIEKSFLLSQMYYGL